MLGREGGGRPRVSCVSLNTQRCVYVTETMSHQGSLPSQGVRARLDPREHLHGLGSWLELPPSLDTSLELRGTDRSITSKYFLPNFAFNTGLTQTCQLVDGVVSMTTIHTNTFDKKRFINKTGKF